MIRRDLEQLRRLVEAVDLVEHDAPARDAGEEALGVGELPPDARQLTVEVLDPRQAAREDGLAGPPDPHEPDDVLPAPCPLDQALPRSAPPHAGMLPRLLTKRKSDCVWYCQTQVGLRLVAATPCLRASAGAAARTRPRRRG